MVIHDYFDDGKYRGEVAAPEDGNDRRRENTDSDVDAMSKRDFESAGEVVHIGVGWTIMSVVEGATTDRIVRPTRFAAIFAGVVEGQWPRFVANSGGSSKGGEC
jgi:hypothetical protein